MSGLKKYSSGQPWLVLALLFIPLFLASCVPVTSPTTYLEPCKPGNIKLYSGQSYPELQDAQAQKTVDAIFGKYPEKPDEVKKLALRFLGYETQRWSDFRSTSDSDPSKLKTLVTFISPGLIRAIALSQALSTAKSYPNFGINEVQNITNKYIKIFDDQNDFGFFILYMPADTSTPQQNFEIPPSSIELHSTVGKQIKSNRSDDYLNAPLSFAKTNYSGFVFYPIGGKNGESCDPLLVSKSGTSLTLKILTASIAGKQNIALSWQFYFPLLTDTEKLLIDINSDNSAVNSNELSPKNEPSSKDYSNDPENIYWQEMGRFIWWKLTLEPDPTIH